MAQNRKKTPPTPTTTATPTTRIRFASLSRRKSNVNRRRRKATIGIASELSSRRRETQIVCERGGGASMSSPGLAALSSSVDLSLHPSSRSRRERPSRGRSRRPSAEP
jgi:hypothetical protein